MLDLLIVGTGPAGVSAALTARARGLSFLWFGSRRLSDKVEKAERILNYPGLPRVTGRELRDAFLRQVDDLGIPIQQARVAEVYEMGGHYAVCAGPDFYEGRCLLLATGVAAGGQIPGESRLLGKGVSCCATCDGELYRGGTSRWCAKARAWRRTSAFCKAWRAMWNCSAPTRAVWPIHRAATKAGPKPSRGTTG